MKYIYCLMHSYDNSFGEPEDKILSYFETHDEAINAISKYKRLPGFSKYLDGFIVDKIEFGSMNWASGFETVLDNEPI